MPNKDKLKRLLAAAIELPEDDYEALHAVLQGFPKGDYSGGKGETLLNLVEELRVSARNGGALNSLAGLYSTLADDASPKLLGPGEKASVYVKKQDRYLPFIVTDRRWDAHGGLHYTATHASAPWAVEFEAGRFTPGWPDGIADIPADAALTARARGVFLDTGNLRVATIPTQLARGIANSLWPHLKSERWREHTCTRDLAAYNPVNREQFGSNGFRTTPSAVTSVIQHHERWIEAMLYAKEWFGDDGFPAENYAIMLTREAYDDTLRDMPAASRFALLGAYAAKLPAPFREDTNRHGKRRLRRTNHEPAITQAVGEALESIARAAYACPVSEDAVEAFHSGDIDLYPDLVSSVPRLVTHASRRG